ncbi:MAG: hypothetical protein JRF40_00540 [Deltaproteobacteria bacterium]|nr:hypothetical protein [Deltaproteobacteria bacterium]
MRSLIIENLNHFICALILIARLTDILTAYKASPKNKMGPDPLIRKYWWPFSISTLFVCLAPYIDTRVGVMMLVPFLFLSFSKISGLWAVTSLGEEDYISLMMVAGSKSKISSAIYYMVLSQLMLVFLGVILICVPANNELPLFIGYGILMYSCAYCVNEWGYYRKLFKQARQEQYEVIIRKIPESVNSSELKPINDTSEKTAPRIAGSDSAPIID